MDCQQKHALPTPQRPPFPSNGVRVQPHPLFCLVGGAVAFQTPVYGVFYVHSAFYRLPKRRPRQLLEPSGPEQLD
jgi:hypothetical protein